MWHSYKKEGVGGQVSPHTQFLHTVPLFCLTVDGQQRHTHTGRDGEPVNHGAMS